MSLQAEVNTGYTRELELPPFETINDDYLPDNVTVHFHFAPHKTAEHFEGAKELLKEADVYAPELAGWDEKALQRYRAVAKGDKKAIAKDKAESSLYNWNEHHRVVMNALAGSYKSVIFVDANDKQRQYMVGDFTKLYKSSITSDVETSLSNLANATSMVAYKSSMRDRIIVQNLGQALTTLVTNHPRLIKQNEVKVLATLGYGHGLVYDHLASSASSDKISGSWWSGIYPNDPEHSVVEQYRQGMTPERTDLIALLTATALGFSALAGFDATRGFYDFAAMHSRNVDMHSRLGAKTLEVFMQDPELAANWAVTTLRAGAGISRGDSFKLLKQNAMTANDLLTEECSG
jgi:hypothetical protein